MTSRRKILGNRANAKRSTGPRSAAGKIRAARNARRHGLAIPVWSQQEFAPDIESLARQIAGVGPGSNAVFLQNEAKFFQRSVPLRDSTARGQRHAGLAGRCGILERFCRTNPNFRAVSKVGEFLK
jgi:hypothetical protein